MAVNKQALIFAFALPLIIISLILAVQTPRFAKANADSAPSAPTVEWQHSYNTGSSGFSGINVMIQTADGGYALAGSAMALIAGDIGPWLTKTDSVGNQQWMQFYFADSFNVNLPGAYAVVQLPDGGYLMAGGEYLTRADAQGKMQWRQNYNGIDINATHLWSLINASDSGCVVAGSTAEGKCWLGKVNSTGGLEWSHIYPLACTQSFAVKTDDGRYAVAGYSYLTSDGNSAFLIETDSLGNMLWNRTFGGSLDGFQVFSLATASDGGFALAGTKFGVATLAKTDSAGNLEWSQSYSGTVNPGQVCVIQTGDAGYAFGYGIDLVKTDPLGTPQWTLPLEAPVCSLVQTSDGGLVIAGSSNALQGWLAKTSNVSQAFTPTPTFSASPTITPSSTPSLSPTQQPTPSVLSTSMSTPVPTLTPTPPTTLSNPFSPPPISTGAGSEYPALIVIGLVIVGIAVVALMLYRRRQFGFS